ncbi:MAG: hypothetical protein GXP29_10150 [Planctomycetes bacterium]|nr:hypothetical protein [Planctomycetota bacterium]
MDRWQILGACFVGGLGALTFLRIVGNEVVVKSRAIEALAEHERSERERLAEQAAQKRLQQDLEKQKTQKKASVTTG